MLRSTVSVAGAWLLIAPLTGSVATGLRLVPSDAITIDRSAPRYVQNSVVPVQPSTARKFSQAQGPEKVYLLRGFLNVFSLGMDDLAAKLQADGISATVINHAEADLVASRIVTNYNGGDRGPIVLIGHSLGADAVVEVANGLARYNIQVALTGPFRRHRAAPNSGKRCHRGQLHKAFHDHAGNRVFGCRFKCRFQR